MKTKRQIELKASCDNCNKGPIGYCNVDECWQDPNTKHISHWKLKKKLSFIRR